MKTTFNTLLSLFKVGVLGDKRLPRLTPYSLLLIPVMLLFAIPCFSQRSRPYYPNAHDTGGNEMPEHIKKNFLYYGFLSSINQHISFEYDREMSDEVMLAVSFGIINSGLSQEINNNSVGGAYGECGVKLFLNPDYASNGRHNYFAEEGIYIKPQIVVSVFNTIETSYVYSPYAYPPPTTNNQYSFAGFALLVNLGMQWQIAHTLIFDLYAGVGVCFSSSNSPNVSTTTDYYSYLTTGSGIPLAFTAGVNIGLPFK